MAVQAIDTGWLKARDRLPYWTELAGKFIAPISIEAMDRDAFEARMYRATFRDCEIVSPVSSPARICNGTGADAGILNLQLQHVGTSVNSTAGRTSVLNEGDFLLFDPALPLELTFTEPTQTIVLRLPIAYTEARLPHLRAMAGVPVRGNSGAGALFSGFMRKAWRQLEEGENDWGDELSDVIWPLLDLAYAAVRPSAAHCSGREAWRRAVFAMIETNLTDATLDTQAIATRVGVSPRSVQLMFAEMATTPSAYIQRLRLEKAAARLARENGAATITGIAFDCGFNDLSSFCRAFRRRFAMSPSDWRVSRGRPAVRDVEMATDGLAQN